MKGFITNVASGKVFPVVGIRNNPHAVDSMLQYGRLYIEDPEGRRVAVHEMRNQGEYFLQREEGLVDSSSSSSDSDSSSSSSSGARARRRTVTMKRPATSHHLDPSAASAAPRPTRRGGPHRVEVGRRAAPRNIALLLRRRVHHAGSARSRHADVLDWLVRTHVARPNSDTATPARQWTRHVEPNGPLGRPCTTVPYSPVVPVSSPTGLALEALDDDDDDDSQWLHWRRDFFASDADRILTAERLAVAGMAGGEDMLVGARLPGTLWAAPLRRDRKALRVDQRAHAPQVFPSLPLWRQAAWPATTASTPVTSLHVMPDRAGGAPRVLCTVLGSAAGGAAMIAPLAPPSTQPAGGAPTMPTLLDPTVHNIASTVFCSEPLPGGDHAVIGCGSRVLLLDVATGALKRRLHLEKGVDCMSLAADTDRRHTAYCGLRNGHLRMMDMRANANRLTPMLRLDALITAVAYTHGLVLTRTSDTALKVWDVRAPRAPLLDLLPRPAQGVHQSDALLALGWRARKHGGLAYVVSNHRGALWAHCLNTGATLAQTPLPPGNKQANALVTTPLDAGAPAVWIVLDRQLHAVNVAA